MAPRGRERRHRRFVVAEEGHAGELVPGALRLEADVGAAARARCHGDAAAALVEQAEAAGVAAREEADATVTAARAEAERLGFRGSPTILLDGRDPFAATGDPVGLSCRVYRNEEGLEGAPSLARLRAALLKAAHEAGRGRRGVRVRSPADRYRERARPRIGLTER